MGIYKIYLFYIYAHSHAHRIHLCNLFLHHIRGCIRHTLYHLYMVWNPVDISKGMKHLQPHDHDLKYSINTSSGKYKKGQFNNNLVSKGEFKLNVRLYVNIRLF